MRDTDEAREGGEHIPCFQGAEKIKKALDSRLLIGSGCHTPNIMNGFGVAKGEEVEQ